MGTQEERVIFHPNEAASNEVILKVCGHSSIKMDYLHLGRKLGVSESVLAEIEEKPNLLREKCYQMLLRWRSQEGRNATMNRLMSALRECEYNDIPDSYGAPSLGRITRGYYSAVEMWTAVVILAAILSIILMQDFNQSSVYNADDRIPGNRFVGREKEIKDVLDNWGKIRMFGIFGFSGIGKSRFARHVTEIIRKSKKYGKGNAFHRYIIDLRGVRSSNELRLSFLTSMSLDTSVSSYVTEIRARIDQSEDTYVFIIENAEDVDENEDLRDDFLRHCAHIVKDNNRVTMLITSKIQFSTTETVMKQIDIPPLSNSEAKTLLEMTLPHIDLGDWIDSLLERLDGNPQLIKMAEGAIKHEKSLSIPEYVKLLSNHRLETMNDNRYPTDKRTEGMVNLLLSRVPPDQRLALRNLSYMHNTFSKKASKAILGETGYNVAYLKLLRPLFRRYVLDMEEYENESRLYIHGIVRDWIEVHDPLTGTHLQEVRKRFVEFFCKVMDDVHTGVHSNKSGRALRCLVREIMNLRKLLKESSFVNDETYDCYKMIAFSYKYMIIKYLPDAALHFFQNMHEVFIKHADEFASGVMMSRIGYVHTNVYGNLTEGLHWYEKAETALEKGGRSPQLSSLYQHKGWNLHHQGDKITAIRYLEKAHRMVKVLGLDKSHLAMIVLASMGVVYTSLENLDKGRDFHHKAIQLSKELYGRQYSLGAYYNNLAINYNLRGDLENALKYSKLGLEIKREFLVGPEISVVLSLNSVAMYYLKARNDIDKTKNLLNEARQMLAKLHFPALMEGLTMDNYCQLHIKTQTFDEGVSFCEAAVNIYRKYKPRHVIFAESLTNYAETLHGLRRQLEAYNILQEALKLKRYILQQMPKRYYLFEIYRMLAKVTTALEMGNESKVYYGNGISELQRLYDLHSKQGNHNDIEIIKQKKADFEKRSYK